MTHNLGSLLRMRICSRTVAAAFFVLIFIVYILIFFPFLHDLCNRVVTAFLRGLHNLVLRRFLHSVLPLFWIFYFVHYIAKFTSVLSNLLSNMHRFL